MGGGESKITLNKGEKTWYLRRELSDSLLRSKIEFVDIFLMFGLSKDYARKQNRQKGIQKLLVLKHKIFGNDEHDTRVSEERVSEYD